MPFSLPQSHADLVLIVDDNEMKAYTTRRMLEQAGLRVATEQTGMDALRAIRETRPAVVVLDIRLPDIDGIEVCRRIKSDPEMASTLVLHLSAHRTSSGDQAYGLQAGADAYLTVPVEADVLVGTVQALLRLHRAEEDARAAARRWQVTFDAISDAICLIDAQGVVRRGNEAFATFLRQPIGAIVGRALSDLTQDGLGVLAEPLDTLMEASAGATREVAFSEGRYFRITTDPVYEADLRTGVVCIFSDISERKTLEAQLQAAYAREKHIAESFQMALMTPVIEQKFPDLSIESQYVPAWGEAQVGGDFYDTFAVDARRVALVVADASGKGLVAALRTTEVKHALRAFLWECGDPQASLYRLNNFVNRSQEESGLHAFVTIALVLIDRETGAIEVCSAGAESPVLLREGTTGEAIIFDTGGTPLGVVPDEQYPVTHAEMAVGDTLLLVTDGITEARVRKEFFGAERMVDVAQTAHALPNAPLRDVGDAIVREARAFARGAFQDDVCLLLARRM